MNKNEKNAIITKHLKKNTRITKARKTTIQNYKRIDTKKPIMNPTRSKPFHQALAISTATPATFFLTPVRTVSGKTQVRLVD